MPLDPRSLLVLHEVAQAGTLTGAARTLGWTHPAVSQHIRRLERLTGLALVERAGRGVRLTYAGGALAAGARQVSIAVKETTETARVLRDGGANVLRIAAFPTASATFVVDALTQLGAADPPVLLDLVQHEPPGSLTALHAGEVDLAVVFSYAPISAPDLIVHQVGRDPLQVVVDAKHPLATRDTIALTDLEQETWIAGCEICRAHLKSLAYEAAFAPNLHDHFTEDYTVVQALISAGIGVALLPQMALNVSQRTDVVSRPLQPESPRLITAVTTPAGSTLPAVRRTLDALRSAFARLRPSR